jgi:hypothetical protein
MARVARYRDDDEHWAMDRGLVDERLDEDGGLAHHLPPGVAPNNAIFGAHSLPRPLSWQRPEHAPQRRAILARVARLLSPNAQLVASASGAGDKTWALARKLEVLLFLNSASMMEYTNPDSLARRVQALTAGIVNKKIRRTQAPPAAHSTPAVPVPTRPAAPAVSRASESAALPGISALMTHKKRSVEEMQQQMDMPVPRPPVKRLRAAPGAAAVAVPSSLASSSEPTELGTMLFRGDGEMAKMVWSFVDGVQIMRCRQVNRSACTLLPLFVSSLQLSCNAVQRALATKKGPFSVLQQCANLQHLEIVSLSSMGMTFGKLSMRATDCPQRFVVTHDDHEQIVLALSEQMRLRAFSGLKRLVITCLFTNEEADGEADVLLSNLMLGSCPDLEELCLPGNSFGDYGAMKVAQMLRSEVCPKLTRLDLRRNFIGEDGLRSLCHALADGCAPHLVELCLGGNMLTDSSFHHILFAMESGQLRKLRFLGVEANYLSANSMEMLGRTIGKLVCPVLSQISYNDNSVDNATAKRVIATSVYQERVWQAKLQQQIRDRGHAAVAGSASTMSSDDEYDDDDGAYSDV